MTFKPTPEQEAILAEAKGTNDNLIVAALAGAAKTSTLVLLGEALPRTSILTLAFNKRIAVEMKERLPMNCESMTLNSLGHRTWGQVVGKRLTLDTSKTYNILKEAVAELKKGEREEAQEYFADLLQIVQSSKSCGYVPTGHYTDTAKPLMNDDDFFYWLDEPPTELMEKLIRSCALRSIRLAYAGIIDFDDQIFMPTVFPATFPSYPLVMVDEAQDLSALNHATLKKLAKKRLFAVGDECQSIYGFRGAHQESMDLLQETFSMRKLILSVSFRCPRNVVREAQWRAPHMKFPEWAKDGSVSEMKEWDAQTVPDGAVIICRNNSPLFTIAIKLLKNGRYPQLIGNDIGKYLVKIMKKFGPDDLPKAEVFKAINAWAEEKLRKHRNPDKVHDQVTCMKIFAEQGDTLFSIIKYAEHIFASQGPIQLMTGHKSKGLEFDNVYILDKHLIRMKEEQQEKNLMYVMQTRAKSTLTYINTADFFDPKDEEDPEKAVENAEA